MLENKGRYGFTLFARVDVGVMVSWVIAAGDPVTSGQQAALYACADLCVFVPVFKFIGQQMRAGHCR